MVDRNLLPVQLSYLEQDAPGATLLELYIGTNEPLTQLCPYCFSQCVTIALAHLVYGDDRPTEPELVAQLRKHTYHHLPRKRRSVRVALLQGLLSDARRAGELS